MANSQVIVKKIISKLDFPQKFDFRMIRDSTGPIHRYDERSECRLVCTALSSEELARRRRE